MYGILVVEDGNELYHIIGEVSSPREACELADDYERRADPEDPSTPVPPNEFIIWTRDSDGYYLIRETLETASRQNPRLALP